MFNPPFITNLFHRSSLTPFTLRPLRLQTGPRCPLSAVFQNLHQEGAAGGVRGAGNDEGVLSPTWTICSPTGSNWKSTRKKSRGCLPIANLIRITRSLTAGSSTVTWRTFSINCIPTTGHESNISVRLIFQRIEKPRFLTLRKWFRWFHFVLEKLKTVNLHRSREFKSW